MRHLVFAVLLAATACVEPAPDRSTTAAALYCEDWGCTGNTPVMGGYGFIELNELGLPNNAGLRVDGLWKNGVRYEPQVVGARLIGRSGDATISGPALTNAYLRILDEDDEVYRINIKHVSRSLTFWILPGNEVIETYRLKYHLPGQLETDAPIDLCEVPGSSDVGDGNHWANLTEAILFTGDRYDYDSKRLRYWTEDKTKTWFNIGCAGSAVAKVFLNGFAAAAERPGHPTQPRERDDLLSMYTGNVCGKGRSFTVAHTPIDWGVANGLRDVAGGAPYESVWGGGRALCLDTWRLGLKPADYAAIATQCGAPLPACQSQSWFASWSMKGTVLSRKP